MFQLLRPLLFTLPEEAAHRLAIKALKLGLVPSPKPYHHPSLFNYVFDLPFKNPVGLAAGFDKNAEVIVPLLKQGFGFIEVGTATPLPQIGNPKPRLFRLPEDEAIINRMGMCNLGAKAFIERLEVFGKHTNGTDGIVGANISQNKDVENPISDVGGLLEKTLGFSDYITINISSPNTPNLRNLQTREHLPKLLEHLTAIRKAKELTEGHIPLLLKIAPDMTPGERRDVAQLALEYRIDGLILTNTTVSLRDKLKSKKAHEHGGLSGRPLFQLATDTLREFYILTEGKIPLIGTGGISSGDDAYTKIRAGASLVQIYSALIYQGFGLVNAINQRLVVRLLQDGFSSIKEAIGADIR